MGNYQQRPQVQRPRPQQVPQGYTRHPGNHPRRQPEPPSNGKFYVIIAILALLVVVLTVALFMTNCTGPEQSAEQQGQGGAHESGAQVDFDGSAYADTGAGVMYLRTAGGTSEDGNVPEIAVQKDTMMMQIELDTEGMDGSVCTVYIDGMENTTINAGELTQQAITLQGDALKSGSHTVELVKMDGDVPAIYKKAEYKVA